LRTERKLPKLSIHKERLRISDRKRLRTMAPGHGVCQFREIEFWKNEKGNLVTTTWVEECEDGYSGESHRESPRL
jgi:hypothetical protein